MPGGEFPDVVGGNTATAARQNEVQHRMVNHFTSAAQRDSLWPTPPEGSVCYLDDLNVLQLFETTMWQDIVTIITGDQRYVNVTGSGMSGPLVISSTLDVTGATVLGDTTMEKAENITPLNDGDTKLRNMAIGVQPSTAIVGDLWVDVTGKVLNRWNGSIWEPILTGV